MHYNFDALINLSLIVLPNPLLGIFATAIDLYLFLTYNSFNMRQKIEVSWKSLHQQFGAEYTDIKNFTREAKKHLKTLCVVYPSLQIEHSYGKINILPTSKPSVNIKM